MTSKTVFVFGRTPDLSFAEISHVFPNTQIQRIHKRIAVADVIVDPEKIIDTLGGTVAIGEVLGEFKEIQPSLLAEIIKQKRSSAVTFGISSLGAEPYSEFFLRQVKKELAENAIVSRYIVNKKTEPLSAVVVNGQHVEEYIVVPVERGNVLIKTLAVQCIPEWVKRDFKRPCADPKRGMLPPKVARMLVNIVSNPFKKEGEQQVLLDPFCGMGTILAEALLVGWDVIGSDISNDVVVRAEKNLMWIKKEYSNISRTHRIFSCDAVHISEALHESRVDCIVTEPFMGSTSHALSENVNTIEVKNVLKGLEKLYIGCLKDWHNMLKQHGFVLIALPSYRLKGRELFVKKVIDSCETLGYSIKGGPWHYSRPNALVQRNFYLLQKQ